MNNGHKYKEAFALMWYACECGHRERVWNSRDGVTPYGMQCPSCGQIMYHTDFAADEQDPDHTLHNGQLFFRDGTLEEARAIMQDRLTDLPDEDRAELLTDEALVELGEFQPGWPTAQRYSV